ncbi:hypothetical protein FS837_002296 [Tulasnella sp. UAMH 9824]|nr:hypothetical protein FS837_002296 [Tulasnella sp. UAMH 9824]
MVVESEGALNTVLHSHEHDLAGWRGSYKLVLLVDWKGVLAFGSTAPSSPGPTSSGVVEDKVATVKGSVTSVPSEGAGLHRDVPPVEVGPARMHRSPAVRAIVEVVVEREAAPVRSRYGGVVPERAPGFSGIGAITLEEGVFGLLEFSRMHEHGVGGCAVLVWIVVAVVEQLLVGRDIHAVRAKDGLKFTRPYELPVAVESGSHLGLVGGLGPRAVRGGTLSAIGDGVGDGVVEFSGGGVGGVISDDGEDAHGQTAVADAVPVVVGNRSPCAVNEKRLGSSE